MLELTLERFHIVLPMLRDVNYDILIAQAVLEGKNRGRVFADNDIEPRVALVAQS